MSLPGWSVITRYLIWRVGCRAAQALLLLLIIYAAIDIVETRSLAGQAKEGFLFWYLFKLPSIAAMLLPLALTLGVQLEIALLKSRGEWDAMSSGGISPFRTLSRLLAIPVMAAVVALPLQTELGPRALGLFERALDQTSSSARVDRTDWFRHDGLLVRPGAGADPDVAILRFPDGEPKARYEIPKTQNAGQSVKVWRAGVGFGTLPAESLPRIPAHRQRLPVTGAALLPGATLTDRELGEMIAALKASGHAASPLEAERALRICLIAACCLLPFATASLTIGAKESRATRHAALAIAACAIYWLIVATAWNGALLSAWSPRWLSLGAPAGFGVLTLAVHTAARLKHRF